MATDRMEICVHVVKDKVDVAVVLGLEHVAQPDDVLVLSQRL